jgi:hypothetical protein
MTDLDHIVARSTFERIRSEAKLLSFVDMMILKKAMGPDFNYTDLPERLQRVFADIGMGGASAYSTAIRNIKR